MFRAEGEENEEWMLVGKEFLFWGDEKSGVYTEVIVVQYSEYNWCLWIIHLNMVANFIRFLPQ